jgi:iron only hydrogenase large subunit-like protein
MAMLSVLIKTYYAEKEKLDPKDIFVVGVMPCVAKKFEASRRDQYMADSIPYTDAVLTTRELIWMIKSYGIDFVNLPEGRADAPLGFSTGAADIFGTTGGVMEAALRTAAARIVGPQESVEFADVRAVEGLREAAIKLGDLAVNVAVTNGLNNAKIVLDKVVRKEKQFHIIEVMACPGGCIGGGGQPYPPAGVKVLDPELLRKRACALYDIDTHKQLRMAHENPAVRTLYDEYLGEPASHKAHELLHTRYLPRLPRGIK